MPLSEVGAGLCKVRLLTATTAGSLQLDSVPGAIIYMMSACLTIVARTIAVGASSNDGCRRYTTLRRNCDLVLVMHGLLGSPSRQLTVASPRVGLYKIIITHVARRHLQVDHHSGSSLDFVEGAAFRLVPSV